MSVEVGALIVLKILTLVGLLVYVIFAAIMVRQEQLMAKSLEATYEPILRLLTLLHLAAAIGVFLLAVIFL